MGVLRITASIRIDAISFPNWFPIVPIEDRSGKSATPLAGNKYLMEMFEV